MNLPRWAGRGWITLALATLLSPTARVTAQTPVRSIERLDPALDALVAPDAKIELLADGFDWTEGPVWSKSGGYLLFSDIPRNAIHQWKDGQGVSLYMRPAGYAGSSPYGDRRRNDFFVKHLLNVTPPDRNAESADAPSLSQGHQP